MRYTLVFHTHVEADISDAYNWYEDKQEGLGERLLSELIIGYNKLETQPESYSKTIKTYRKLVLNHFPYLIAYEIVRSQVIVYAVFHSSRNPKEILKRKKSD